MSNALIDATCTKCGKRHGWLGNMTNRPPCPKCGHVTDPKINEADQKIMDEFRNLLRERQARKDATAKGEVPGT